MPFIAIHLPDLRGGGAERVMVNLANEFADRGHRVELVLSRAEGPHLSNISNSVLVRDLEATKFPGYAAFGAFWPLKKYLEIENPDILLSGIARANIVALFAHRFSSIDSRIIVSEHNNLSHWLNDEGGLRMAAVPYMITFAYRWADRIIAVSDGVGDDFAEVTGIDRDEITTIYNPVVTDEILEKAQEPSPHPWFESEEPVILGAGSFTSQKDFSTLIHAFDKLRDMRSAKLVIIGKGPEKQTIEALIRDLELKDDVLLPGFVDNPYRYLNHASVFVLSSKYEGLSNVLIEALACGTPVVSTDCPSGPREILKDGKYGPLVPVGDASALAEAIDEVLESPIPKSQLVERASNFRLETIASEYLDVLIDQ